MTKQEKPWNNQSMPEYLEKAEIDIRQNSATELEEEKLLHEFKELLLKLFNKNTHAGTVKEDEILSQIEQMKKTPEQAEQPDNIGQGLVENLDSMTYDDVVEHIDIMVKFLESTSALAVKNDNKDRYFDCDLLIARLKSLPDIFNKDKQEYVKQLRDILNKTSIL